MFSSCGGMSNLPLTGWLTVRALSCGLASRTKMKNARWPPSWTCEALVVPVAACAALVRGLTAQVKVTARGSLAGSWRPPRNQLGHVAAGSDCDAWTGVSPPRRPNPVTRDQMWLGTQRNKMFSALLCFKHNTVRGPAHSDRYIDIILRK